MIRQSTLDKWKPIIDGYDKAMFIKRILFNEQYQSKIIYQKQTADLWPS